MVVASSLPKVLLVSNSHGAGWMPPLLAGWTVHTVVNMSIHIGFLASAADKSYSPMTKLILYACIVT